MNLKFMKMSGAGNDFIMIDNRDGKYTSILDKEKISDLCRRALSVGADGLIEVRKSSSSAAFVMKYYNSDGGAAEMCGNGARCICRFAVELGLVSIGTEFSFESDAGVHKGLVTSSSEARIWLTEPVLHYLQKELDGLDGIEIGFANTGVPHVVVFSEDIEDGSFEKYASLIRSNKEFGSAGVNVNWIQFKDNGSLEMRTFERGVEGETLACGTGAVASALIASEKFDSIVLPVTIKVRSGLDLVVGQDLSGWWLQGEARLVYRAETDC